MKHGTTEIAFIEDPTGYKVELIQSKKIGFVAIYLIFIALDCLI